MKIDSCAENTLHAQQGIFPLEIIFPTSSQETGNKPFTFLRI